MVVLIDIAWVFVYRDDVLLVIHLLLLLLLLLLLYMAHTSFEIYFIFLPCIWMHEIHWFIHYIAPVDALLWCEEALNKFINAKKKNITKKKKNQRYGIFSTGYTNIIIKCIHNATKENLYFSMQPEIWNGRTNGGAKNQSISMSFLIV